MMKEQSQGRDLKPAEKENLRQDLKKTVQETKSPKVNMFREKDTSQKCQP